MSSKENDILLESLKEDIEDLQVEIAQTEERIIEERKWLDVKKGQVVEMENRILEIQGLTHEQDLIDLKAQEEYERNNLH